MTSAQLGRPFCIAAQIFLTEEGSVRELLEQCRECKSIRYIGCPSFRSRHDMHDAPSRDWAQWWYYDMPIPDKNHSCKESAKDEKR